MIKEAVEKMFEGTEVKTVNTMNLDGKKNVVVTQLEEQLRQKSNRYSDREQQGHRNLRRSVRLQSGQSQ